MGDCDLWVLSGLLARHGYAIQGRDMGGLSSRTLRLDLATGQVSLKMPGANLSYL